MYNNYIIFGSTGKSGLEIVNQLISMNKKVTIVVRDVTKAKTIFKENYEKIHKVIEATLGNGSALQNNELKSEMRKNDCLISALGSAINSNPKLDEYVSIKELIILAEEAEVKKFVFITSLYVTRPYAFVAFILNNVISFVLGWKSLAENKLRLSKLDYMIIRPGGLMDPKEPKESKEFYFIFFI